MSAVSRCTCDHPYSFNPCPIHGEQARHPQPPPDGAGRAEFEAWWDSDQSTVLSEIDGSHAKARGWATWRAALAWAARSRPAPPAAELSEDYARVRRELDAALDELRRLRAVSLKAEPKFWAVKRKTENDPDYLARSYMQAVDNQERCAYYRGCAINDVEIIPLYTHPEAKS